MKNQYFGDARDLFKYDLIECILNKLDAQQFTLIPMLTSPDDSKHGEKRDFEGRPGTNNADLTKFLEKYNKPEERRNERNIKEIRKYFEPKGIKIKIYKEENEQFGNDSRNSYFEGIIKNNRDNLLTNPLIFVDPDIGLETEKSKPSEKHLLIDDAKKLYEHMGTDSILMIYQNLPLDRSILEYLPSGRAKTLQEKIQAEYSPLYISDNEICFLFSTKNKELRDELVKILRKYIESYKDFFTRLRISNVSSD